ncbi:RNA-guided endonuclease InsQ/TnpB family protein [Nocardiopsis suaedae]|uniref:Transposase n=1 Tax=Nocardiopsis suaedae TaxID=3018444 RepID=A0ABT4TL69_9ACTN|nr:transposase [Nocardiopsis suaedae]MDA2804964.1 transposase [Nocardiopsis suaedae]
MQLRYQYRVYPTPGQRIALARLFGCARVVFNDGLRYAEQVKDRTGRRPSNAEIQRKVITEAKRTPERAWPGEVSHSVLQQSVRDLGTAYKNWRESRSGSRKGGKLGHPRFKSRKDNRQAVRCAGKELRIHNGKLVFPKVGALKVRWSRDLPSAPSSVTLIKDAAGRYFASFVVGTDDEPLPESTGDVGIDLGLSAYAILDDGTKVCSPRFFRRAQRKLRRVQRAHSRKAQGSNNRARHRVKVARVHARVAAQRSDFQHKLSTRLIRDNQAVYVEGLSLAGLLRGNAAKSWADAGFSAFVRMLEYKAARYGRAFAKADRFFPSTQMCSECGSLAGPKGLEGLKVRVWSCSCGARHDRDVNAARNVLAAGRAES